MSNQPSVPQNVQDFLTEATKNGWELQTITYKTTDESKGMVAGQKSKNMVIRGMDAYNCALRHGLITEPVFEAKRNPVENKPTLYRIQLRNPIFNNRPVFEVWFNVATEKETIAVADAFGL